MGLRSEWFGLSRRSWTRQRLHAVLVGLALLAGCGAPRPPSTHAPGDRGVHVTEDLVVRPLAPGVLLHTSWRTLPAYGRISSNGVVVLGRSEALLVDTAWGEGLTEALLDHIAQVHDRRVTHLIVTHAHDDRIGGLRVALSRGVVVHELALTAALAEAQGYPPPTETFARELSLDVDGIHADAFFPGAAHAPDNVVVFLPAARILVGGCMIREAAAPSVGNLADASLSTWIDSVRAVAARFPDASIVVPGHGEPGDASLLARTEELVRAASP